MYKLSPAERLSDLKNPPMKRLQDGEKTAVDKDPFEAAAATAALGKGVPEGANGTIPVVTTTPSS